MLRLAASRGGGPETRSGTVQSLKCCPCQQKRAARLPSAAPRNALGHRPEPEVLPLPAETSREAPKCCAWQHQVRGGAKPSAAPGSIKGGGGPRNASRNEPRGCQVLCLAASRGGAPKRARDRPEPAVRLPSAAPGSSKGGPRNALGHRPEPEVLPLPAETSREAFKGGGPETRSGTVQSLKCCPCQQKRAARLPSAAPGSIKGGGPDVFGSIKGGGGPETRSGTVQRLPSAAPGSIKRGAPKRARALPAETSREAAKCCAWQHQERARVPSRA